MTGKQAIKKEDMKATGNGVEKYAKSRMNERNCISCKEKGQRRKM